jgi:hypothetical protein
MFRFLINFAPSRFREGVQMWVYCASLKFMVSGFAGYVGLHFDFSILV